MIQRSQSLFLLLAAAITILTLFVPLAIYNTSSGEFVFYATGFKEATGSGSTTSTLPLVAVLSLAALLSVITIFLYRNRKLQIKLCGAIILLLSFSVALLFYYTESVSEAFDSVEASYRWFAVSPLVAIVLVILANRGIRKDEALVKAADRIR